MPKGLVAFVHAAPAAIGPVGTYFREAAPELRVTNLLEDGILRLLDADPPAAEERLAAMLATARSVYGATAAMLTCSGVSRRGMSRLRQEAGIPLFKIDEPMAREAVRLGPRIGLVVSFAPTLTPSTTLLQEAADDQGRVVEIRSHLVTAALEALVCGRAEEHDALLAGGVDELVRDGAQVIVLAQVSMARTVPMLQERVGVPVLTSLPFALAEVRRLALGGA